MDTFPSLPRSGDRHIQDWSPGQHATTDERVKRLTRTIIGGQKRLDAQVAERCDLLTKAEQEAAENAGSHYVQLFCTGAPLDGSELVSAFEALIQAHLELVSARIDAADSLTQALIEAQR